MTLNAIVVRCNKCTFPVRADKSLFKKPEQEYIIRKCPGCGNRTRFYKQECADKLKCAKNATYEKTLEGKSKNSRTTPKHYWKQQVTTVTCSICENEIRRDRYNLSLEIERQDFPPSGNYQTSYEHATESICTKCFDEINRYVRHVISQIKLNGGSYSK